MSSTKKPSDDKAHNTGFVRTHDELDRKKRLLSGPELFLGDTASDEYLDRLALRLKLIGGQEFDLADYVADMMAVYESKFAKPWFYRLADLYKVNRSVMDQYVKPEFVRQFILQFVYGRFPYKVLRSLRSRNRKTSSEKQRTKLFQHLTKDASEQLDVVINQVFEMMALCCDPSEFKLLYSKTYKVYFQLEIGF